MTQGSDVRAETNRLIAYHGAISGPMTAERTSLESGLIPVTAYILVSAAEAWYRWPEIVRAIEGAKSAEEIGLAGRRPGSRVNAVHLWSAANIYLTGRKFLTLFGLVEDDPEPTWTVLDFWQRAALAYRDDGHLQAWDAGFVLRPYGATVVSTLVAGAAPIDEDERALIKRFNATLMSYLFLLYFDTRVGTGDSGPYPLPDGRTLLVRDFYQLGRSDFAWSEVGAAIPYRNLTAALVLDGVDLAVNDWGTSITDPEDYLDRLVAFGLFTTDTPDRSLRAVGLDQLGVIQAAVKEAQAQHYRNVAAMTRAEKIACGAYVYFAFLRPFAEVAGVADDIDWSVPRDTVINNLYPMLEAVEGGSASEGNVVDSGPYYAPIA